jgi:hypothetical protein
VNEGSKGYKIPVGLPPEIQAVAGQDHRSGGAAGVDFQAPLLPQWRIGDKFNHREMWITFDNIVRTRPEGGKIE